MLIKQSCSEIKRYPSPFLALEFAMNINYLHSTNIMHEFFKSSFNYTDFLVILISLKYKTVSNIHVSYKGTAILL